jgi:two-component system OmpR family sensor kinase
MRVDLGRRLVPLSTLGIGGLLVAVVFGIGLFAFGAYINHVRHDADSLLAEASEIARTLPIHADAADAGRAIAPRFIQPALLVVFADGSSRVTILRTENQAGPTRATIRVRPPEDRSLPQADGLTARLTLGLATAFGLQTLRARGGRLDITVDVDKPRLVADVRGFLPAFSIALLVAVSIAAAIARILTRTALRPLTDVTKALERFSAGDFTAEIIESDGGEPLGALATAYNGAVEQVERAFAERARANAVMRQFVADGGHQLRTPLTVIRGFVGILRSSPTKLDPPEYEHILEMMTHQTLVMGAMIDKLILLEHWEEDTTPDLAAVDVDDLCRDVLAPFRLAHPERVIDVPGASSVPKLALIDRATVAHALSNIVDNALKYTAGPIAVETDTTGDAVHIVISDRGPGLRATDSARVFDRFYRGARRDVEGSGLGLAITKRAIERSGGTIDLQSDIEAGTRIAIRLKAVRTDAYPE